MSENRIFCDFDNGAKGYLQVALLYPDGENVLCRVGRKWGLSQVITKELADAMKIPYLTSKKLGKKYLYIYPNDKILYQKKDFIADYVGCKGDDFSKKYILKISCNDYLFLRKGDKVYSVDVFDNVFGTSKNKIRFYRLTEDAIKTILKKDLFSSLTYSDEQINLIMGQVDLIIAQHGEETELEVVKNMRLAMAEFYEK